MQGFDMEMFAETNNENRTIQKLFVFCITLLTVGEFSTSYQSIMKKNI